MKITDENVEPIDFDEEVDLVGVTGMVMHASRTYEIAEQFRQRNIHVVMGGPYPSISPFEAKEHADAVVMGETEDARAFSSEAMMLLSRKDLLQAEEGNIWLTINSPDRNH